MKRFRPPEGPGPPPIPPPCSDFPGLPSPPAPATGFANIAVVEKGTSMVFDAAGASAIPFVESTAAIRSDRSRKQLAAEAAELLSASVARQSVADVPVAALLSGGIDSSLVVAEHARTKGSQLRTFNVAFPDRAPDEPPLALATARRYGTEHQTVHLDPDDLAPDAVFGLLGHFDQPFADPSLVPT